MASDRSAAPPAAPTGATPSAPLQTLRSRARYLDPAYLLETVKVELRDVQLFAILSAQAIRGLFRGPYYGVDLIEQMDRVGVQSVPIVVLTGLFAGLVLAVQSAYSLSRFGVKEYVAKGVSIAMVRELGPVLSSLMVAGRVGAGIAAELGSMVVGEQIEAMRAMGVDPIRKLVVPRLVAGLTMLPLLSVVGNFMGLVGGWIICVFSLSFSSRFYWSSALDGLWFPDYFMMLTKPFFFGILIALVASHRGLTAEGGTVGVGRATTIAVVGSSILILFADFLLTKIYWVVFPY